MLDLSDKNNTTLSGSFVYVVTIMRIRRKQNSNDDDDETRSFVSFADTFHPENAVVATQGASDNDDSDGASSDTTTTHHRRWNVVWAEATLLPDDDGDYDEKAVNDPLKPS